MRPYGIKLKDRRPMYDYRSDKYNSRGCFNACQCNLCKANGIKHKIRKNTARLRKKLNVLNRMRTPKKTQRQHSKKIIKDNTEG